MKIERQTWDQVRIKSAMGLFRGMKSFRTRFHWKFWQPLDAVGGRIYFGLYGEYDADEIPD